MEKENEIGKFWGAGAWFMSLTLALWVDHLRSGVRDQPGQHGETPSLLKIQKLAEHGITLCNPSYLGG